MSDIRVSVQWKASTVFAGEDVECKITFKNISQTGRSPSPNAPVRNPGTHRERWRETLPLHPIQNAAGPSSRQHTPAVRSSQNNYRTHKSTLSLSAQNGIRQASFPGAKSSTSRGPDLGDNQHRRSVSIVSIGSDGIEEATPHTQPSSFRRPGHGHARAASLQVLPRRNGISSPGPTSAPGSDRAFTVPSPLLRVSNAPSDQGSNVRALSRSQSHTSQPSSTPLSIRRAPSQTSNFKFPQVPTSIDEVSVQPSTNGNDQNAEKPNWALSPKPSDTANGLDKLDTFTRVISPASISGTPRSSGEFYSMSNNSTETLASEYLTQENSRLMPRPAHSRQVSYLAPTRVARPEVLMMGYGQVVGSFTLDGSLINTASFEEVKRKGIVGGQGGGGVVRTELTKRDSGLLGSLGWGNLGDSLGGFLGSSELSSLKEAKGTHSAKSIPILSTPQSILFVDLRLGPGESKSYTYSHPLPKGMPPSHKGKAMKISYNLVVGTQRAAKTAQQNHIRRVEIPFRVLPSVNGRGDILGHDLMSPHTILTNRAFISDTDNAQEIQFPLRRIPPYKTSECPFDDFLSYAEKLLDKPRQNSGAGLISPTEDESRYSMAAVSEEASTMKESIDLAIRMSNVSTSSRHSANRFEITRSGDRVAVIMLARPAYRLGEIVPIVIDFHHSDVACYSLHATLETSETVDPTIALRSKASVHRVTRRIHASQSESTISAGRVLFSPIIPITATPEFITSGVNLDWRLRFEFITSRIGEEESLDEDLNDIMEEVARDERGSVKAAVQGLPCDTLEVTVPLRVYGATGAFYEKIETGEFPI